MSHDRSCSLRSCSLPAKPGVGYKHIHFSDILEDSGDVGWLEIHAENYMGQGGRPIAQLQRLRKSFPISCHGVGLSIGGEGPLDDAHLRRLKRLVSWLEPAVFSEHLAWSTHEGSYYNDLLPLPYTRQTLQQVVDHIDEVQDSLQRKMLLENPSTYLEFEESDFGEIEFLREIVSRTGCDLLLDVNNVFVSSTNRGWDPYEYLNSFPLDRVAEIHLGGHEPETDAQGTVVLIDNHAAEVVGPVWDLYAHVIGITGPLPTLIEWDNDIPDWHTLSAEASKANRVLAALGPNTS